MNFTTAHTSAGCPEAVIRFLAADTPVSFSDPALQQAYLAVYQGDYLTLKHRQSRTLRLPFRGGFPTVLLMGFDSSCAAPFDDFRAAAASLGTALNQLQAGTVLMDRLDQVTFAGEDQLLGQIAGLISGFARDIAVCVNGVSSGLARSIQQVSEQKAA